MSNYHSAFITKQLILRKKLKVLKLTVKNGDFPAGVKFKIVCTIEGERTVLAIEPSEHVAINHALAELDKRKIINLATGQITLSLLQ